MQKPDLENSFYRLDPNMVLEVAELAGFQPTGQFTQLNSYENRVFDLVLNSEPSAGTLVADQRTLPRVIAKFYRPGRWSEKQIIEEHEFLDDLSQEGLPTAAPLPCGNDSTLIRHENMFVGFFPKIQGRLLQEFSLEDLKQIGTRLALLHKVGLQKEFQHRPYFDQHPFNPEENLEFLKPWIWPDFRQRYTKVAEIILQKFDSDFRDLVVQRIHGDFHRGNILHNGKFGNESEYFSVDFDDCLTGPVVQDFWMLFSSQSNEEEEDALLSGYEKIQEFPFQQLELVPLLRALRIINYATWIARRWQDPSFPKLFTEFNTYRYWAEEVEALEKIAWSFD